MFLIFVSPTVSLVDMDMNGYDVMKLKDRAILFHEYDSKGGRDVDDGKGDGFGSGSGSSVGESGNVLKKNLKKSDSTMSARTILNKGITSSNRPNLKTKIDENAYKSFLREKYLVGWLMYLVLM